MQIGRVGDTGTGVCYDHDDGPINVTVTITEGSADSLCNGGRQIATVGSIGIASCGHSTVALTGSPDTFVNSKAVHRVGDTGRVGSSGTYTLETGSPNSLDN